METMSYSPPVLPPHDAHPPYHEQPPPILPMPPHMTPNYSHHDLNSSVPSLILNNSGPPPPNVVDPGYPPAPPHLQPPLPQHLHHSQHHEQVSSVPPTHPPILEPETSIEQSDLRRMEYEPAVAVMPPQPPTQESHVAEAVVHPPPPPHQHQQQPPHAAEQCLTPPEMEVEPDADSQPSDVGSQEEQSGVDEPESQAVAATAQSECADYEPTVDAAPESEHEDDELADEPPERVDEEREEPAEIEAEEPERDESDREEEPEGDRYGDTGEADIEDADVDEPDPEPDNSPPIPLPAAMSPIGEAPPSLDRCSSNSDEPPPMLTAELPIEPLNTSVFNFTEDEEPPPPLHMSMNGSPRKIKIPRLVSWGHGGIIEEECYSVENHSRICGGR